MFLEITEGKTLEGQKIIHIKLNFKLNLPQEWNHELNQLSTRNYFLIKND